MTTTTVAAPPLPTELEDLLRKLRLPHIRRHAPEVVATAKAQRWEPVEVLSKSSNTSNRIKFLLQDLLELKDRGKEFGRVFLVILRIVLNQFHLKFYLVASTCRLGTTAENGDCKVDC